MINKIELTMLKAKYIHKQSSNESYKDLFKYINLLETRAESTYRRVTPVTANNLLLTEAITIIFDGVTYTKVFVNNYIKLVNNIQNIKEDLSETLPLSIVSGYSNIPLKAKRITLDPHSFNSNLGNICNYLNTNGSYIKDRRINNLPGWGSEGTNLSSEDIVQAINNLFALQQITVLHPGFTAAEELLEIYRILVKSLYHENPNMKTLFIDVQNRIQKDYESSIARIENLTRTKNQLSYLTNSIDVTSTRLNGITVSIKNLEKSSTNILRKKT